MNYHQSLLFFHISCEDYESMKTCLSAREMSFRSGETICNFGDQDQVVGLLASGSVSIVRYEPNGSRTILERLNAPDIFGEVLSFQNAAFESITVICQTDCRVMFFDYERILHPCQKGCQHHYQILRNMLCIISEKSILLSRRVEVLSKRTIRDKLFCYFMHLNHDTGSDTFELPFTMVDLADYLSVDRSAMSRELKRMKEEGLITMERRTVHLSSIDTILDSLSS